MFPSNTSTTQEEFIINPLFVESIKTIINLNYEFSEKVHTLEARQFSAPKVPSPSLPLASSISVSAIF